jgi:hypothetical protein
MRWPTIRRENTRFAQPLRFWRDPRKLVRRLTAREVAELRSRHVPQPGDRRRHAAIEELRSALHERFAAVKEVPYG